MAAGQPLPDRRRADAGAFTMPWPRHAGHGDPPIPIGEPDDDDGYVEDDDDDDEDDEGDFDDE